MENESAPSRSVPCPAVARGIEMLHLPMGDLPQTALIYAGCLCLRVGMCIEVLLSAYVTYAQIIENLPCDEDLYLATPTIRTEWDVAQRDYELATMASGPGSSRLYVQRKSQARD
jgi:hypothetical protein